MTLSIEHLSVSSGEKKILDNVSLQLHKGEWFALVGQSGSGKSILSQSISQMLPPTLVAEGKINFNGENTLSLGRKRLKEIRGRKIAYIFQDYQGSFTPFRTIGAHFQEYQKVHGIKDKRVRKVKAIEALESVGLGEPFYKRYPFQLSGGQLQRTSIALSLLLSPELVIADEITTALDSISAHRILQVLKEKQQETGCTILFITHDWRHVRKYADRLAVMKEGKIVECGDKTKVLTNPQHEYTKQLIAAAPVLKASELAVKEGVL
ncbi:ABC transporter ATP-binding protein [Priestia flexa]|uniref:ABC transporter ATP-binding protein n=1 Tax=Priestia flexa TaxID=86664 RepID=UPI000C24A7A3|nr:ABC transporter ATP-binding protein [Priestia flexa]MEC0666397.1 ABC transporter ATP-binding protein [Priestia flexa]MED3825054.1 ABC transporter ATP-binding protein [Priestia flexa]